jgi:peptide subunit release factor 1 (eRF1)
MGDRIGLVHLMPMDDIESDRYETRCPHCGGEAEWSFVNEEKCHVAVVCPNCGRFEMTRGDFDVAAGEISEIDGHEQGR